MDKATKLGILGGMGPQATIALYQRVVDLTAAGSDQEHLPTLIWSDPSIPDRTAAILSGDTEPVYRRLLEDIKGLEREGCTAVAMACNTAHYFADRLQAELRVPFLNMVRLAVSAVKSKGCRRIGILSTIGTVRAEIYQRECRRQGLEAVVPGEAAQGALMELIYGEIKRGLRGNPEWYELADRDLRVQGVDGALIACTELSVFRLEHGVSERYTDALEVLAEECVRACGYPLRSCAPGLNQCFPDPDKTHD